MKAKSKMKLRAMANRLPTMFQLGKSMPDQDFYDCLDKALEVHELIKVSLLNTAELNPKSFAALLEKNLGAEVVQVIGRVVVLFRQSKNHPVIQVED